MILKVWCQTANRYSTAGYSERAIMGLPSRSTCFGQKVILLSTLMDKITPERPSNPPSDLGGPWWLIITLSILVRNSMTLTQMCLQSATTVPLPPAPSFRTTLRSLTTLLWVAHLQTIFRSRKTKVSHAPDKCQETPRFFPAMVRGKQCRCDSDSKVSV